MPRTRTTWTQEQAAQMAARSAATRAARAAQRKLNSKPATTIPIPGNGPDLDHARAAMCARIEAGCSARTAEILSRAIRNLTLELNGGRTRAKPKYVPWSPVPVQSYSVDTHSQTGVGSGKILNEPRTLAPKAVGGSEQVAQDTRGCTPAVESVKAMPKLEGSSSLASYGEIPVCEHLGGAASVKESEKSMVPMRPPDGQGWKLTSLPGSVVQQWVREVQKGKWEVWKAPKVT